MVNYANLKSFGGEPGTCCIILWRYFTREHYTSNCSRVVVYYVIPSKFFFFGAKFLPAGSDGFFGVYRPNIWQNGFCQFPAIKIGSNLPFPGISSLSNLYARWWKRVDCKYFSQVYISLKNIENPSKSRSPHWVQSLGGRFFFWNDP